MADGREPRLFSTRSLYHLCVSAVVDRFRIYKPYLVDLPKSVRFDLYYQVKRTSSCAVVGVTTTESRGREGLPSIGVSPRAMIATLVSLFLRLVVEWREQHRSNALRSQRWRRPAITCNLASVVSRIRHPRRDEFDAFSLWSLQLANLIPRLTPIDSIAWRLIIMFDISLVSIGLISFSYTLRGDYVYWGQN